MNYVCSVTLVHSTALIDYADHFNLSKDESFTCRLLGNHTEMSQPAKDQDSNASRDGTRLKPPPETTTKKGHPAPKVGSVSSKHAAVIKVTKPAKPAKLAQAPETSETPEPSPSKPLTPDEEYESQAVRLIISYIVYKNNRKGVIIFEICRVKKF